MSILPAVHNFTFLQNATWEFYARFCSGGLVTTYNPSTGLFSTAQPHLRTAGQPAILAIRDSSGLTFLPAGFQENRIYYVLADGLSPSSFRLSATAGGAPIAPTTGGQGEMISAVPLDLSGVVIDCDVVGNLDGTPVTTLPSALIGGEQGLVRFRQEASSTTNIETGSYRYDVSLTFTDGTRIYPQTGIITVQATASRN